jgi:hypothetical protein
MYRNSLSFTVFGFGLVVWYGILGDVKEALTFVVKGRVVRSFDTNLRV